MDCIPQFTALVSTTWSRGDPARLGTVRPIAISTIKQSSYSRAWLVMRGEASFEVG